MYICSLYRYYLVGSIFLLIEYRIRCTSETIRARSIRDRNIADVRGSYSPYSVIVFAVACPSRILTSGASGRRYEKLELEADDLNALVRLATSRRRPTLSTCAKRNEETRVRCDESEYAGVTPGPAALLRPRSSRDRLVPSRSLRIEFDYTRYNVITVN